MIILEAPYVSPVMLDWMEESGHAVLANSFALRAAKTRPGLNLIDDAEAAGRVAFGERVYTCSENALDWVLAQGGNKDLARCITLCKDKAATRKAMASVDPSVFFQEGSLATLRSLDVEGLTFPLVVKPNVGFISFGVHVVPDADAWLDTLDTLEAEVLAGSVFPESVIGSDSFVVEGFITGQEYAVDVYFDGEGAPVILNVMQHDFKDAEDTSDHFYFTSKRLMGRAVPALEWWFSQVNKELKFNNFCTHVELRVSHAAGQDPVLAMANPANIHVIEFNPLRFAGLCGTDLGHFAYGMRTYQWYLEDRRPAWGAVLPSGAVDNEDAAALDCVDAAAAAEDAPGVFATCFIVLEKPADWTADDTIDYGQFEADLRKCGGVTLRDLRPMDPAIHGISCFPHFDVADEATFARVREFALNVKADTYLR